MKRVVKKAFAGPGFRAAQWRICRSVLEDEGLAKVTCGRKLIDRNWLMVEEKLSTASPKANTLHTVVIPYFDRAHFPSPCTETP
jgi:hypothetical protein